jgi:hypothetical protein
VVEEGYVSSFLVIRWPGSRRRISDRMVSWDRLRAFGQDPVSRWFVTPVAVLKARLQNGQDMLEPRWMEEFMCYHIYLALALIPYILILRLAARPA